MARRDGCSVVMGGTGEVFLDAIFYRSHKNPPFLIFVP